MRSPAQHSGDDGDATLLTRLAHRAQHDEMGRASIAAALLFAAVCDTGAAPLFDSSDPIQIVLRGPFAALHQDTSIREELPFTLSAEGIDHSIKVRLRGKSRLRVCRFPPLRLNFKKDATAGSVFATQNKLKLVVPCNFSTRAHKDLVEEYAAYRIFNLLSDTSYRVRLLEALFVDPDDRELEREGPRFAFVLEHKDTLADRFDGEESELPEVALGWFDQRQLADVFVFQYLIGNTDWSLVTAQGERVCCHNGTLIETDGPMLYVPYDFDLSGLVDAPYARPHPEIGISSVTVRRYRGFCVERDTLRGAIIKLRDNADAIVDVIRTLPVLTDRDKKRRIDYLLRVLADAHDTDKLLDRFESRCKR